MFSDSSTTPKRFLISVLLQVRATPDNPWQSESWEIGGIVVRQENAAALPSRQTLRETTDERTYLYNGFSVELYRDDAESYYHNLMAEKPSAFVQCSRDENGALIPQSVTLSYAEANSYMEVDDDVFAVAMPPELYRWVERFVLENYVPEKKKKRKRENWKQSASTPPGHETHRP